MSSLEGFSITGDIVAIFGIMGLIYIKFKKNTDTERFLVPFYVISLGFIFGAIPRFFLVKDAISFMGDLSILIFIIISSTLIITSEIKIHNRKFLYSIAYWLIIIALAMIFGFAIYRIVLLWI